MDIEHIQSILSEFNPTFEMKDQLTITVDNKVVGMVAVRLKSDLQMDCLLDLCGVDYLHYGISEWITNDATEVGYSRAQAQDLSEASSWQGPRFMVVIHLLSYEHKYRIRLKVPLGDDLLMPTLTSIWASANWYEREAYDLFGIVFDGHPDLRRILTDYGFQGYPFRKDFPLIGTKEIRYDAKMGKCVYEPVSIENRIGVPKVIRKDHRYINEEDDAR